MLCDGEWMDGWMDWGYWTSLSAEVRRYSYCRGKWRKGRKVRRIAASGLIFRAFRPRSPTPKVVCLSLISTPSKSAQHIHTYTQHIPTRSSSPEPKPRYHKPRVETRMTMLTRKNKNLPSGSKPNSWFHPRPTRWDPEFRCKGYPRRRHAKWRKASHDMFLGSKRREGR